MAWVSYKCCVVFLLLVHVLRADGINCEFTAEGGNTLNYPVCALVVHGCSVLGNIARYGNWFPIVEKEDAVRRYVKKGDLVLELGSYNNVYMDAVVKAGGHYVGLDIKVWFKDRKPHVQADAQKLPFRNSCFDVVLAFDIIEHVENPIQVLREAHRVTKPYGLILVTVPLLRYAEYDPTHLHTYTGEILRRQLVAAGWHVTQLQEEKIFYHRYSGNIFAVAVKPS